MTHAYTEKYRVYVRDPSQAPEGVQLEQGPRGGKWYESSSRPLRTRLKPLKQPAAKKPAAAKKPKEPPKPKRAIGQPFTGGDDPNLPKSIQQESPSVRDSWIKAFNDTLEKGGSEADALVAARQTLPKRTTPKPVKEPKPPKREIGMPYTDANDTNLPTNVKRESEAIRRRWVATFNSVLSGGGSEADAFAAANGQIPDRKKKKAMSDLVPTRAMICLYPEASDAEAIALDSIDVMLSGDYTLEDVVIATPDRLHVTLAYFPVIQPEDRDVLIQEAARAAWYGSPIRARVEGVAMFAPDDDGSVPYVALFDPRPIAPLRDSCSMIPWQSQKHGFIPHMTLAHFSAETSLELEPIDSMLMTFSHMSVVFGDGQRHDFPLGGVSGGSEVAVAYRSLGPSLRGEIDNQQTPADADDSPLQLQASRQASSEDMDDSIATSDNTEEKAGRRLAGSWRARLDDILGSLRELFSWANYEDEDEDEDDHEAMEMKNADGTFFVFKDATGAHRWLSLSSNGFEDREGEIVSTDALERAVAEADKSEDRGTLRLFHLPGSDIGRCDFQGIQGRFLVESGTFDDSELATKALEYFRSTDEVLGTSIGFIYPLSAFDGKVYSEVRIVERSVCPHWAAANPWTAFTVQKEEPVMDSLKADWLSKIAGPDLAQSILARADDATKTLEAQVAFKSGPVVDALAAMRKEIEASGKPEALTAYESLVSAMAGLPSEQKTAEAAAETAADDSAQVDTSAEEATTAEPEAKTITVDASALANALMPLLEPITKALDEVRTAHTTLAKQVTDLGEWQKTIDATPRGAAYRATTSDGNVLDPEKAKDLLGENNPPSNPVAPYIDDLLRGASIS